MRLAAALTAFALLAACGGGDKREPRYHDVLAPVEAVQGTMGFDDPASMAFAPNGDLWVGNYLSGTIARYPAAELARSGAPKPAAVIEGRDIKGPNAMVFDAHGYLWVPMYDSHRVVGFTPADLVAGRAPSIVLPDPDGVLRKPAGVALDRDGNLWVSNSAVGHLVRYPRRGGLEAGTAKPDIVVEVANDDCQAVAVHAGRLWLGCADTDVVYVYPINPRSGRAPFLAKQTLRQCAPVQFVPAPQGAVATACYRAAEVRILGVGGRPEEAAGGVSHQVLTNVHGVAFDASGGLWAGTNYNVLVGYTGPRHGPDLIPDVILRPRPEAVPTVTRVPEGVH